MSSKLIVQFLQLNDLFVLRQNYLIALLTSCECSKNALTWPFKSLFCVADTCIPYSVPNIAVRRSLGQRWV